MGTTLPFETVIMGASIEEGTRMSVDELMSMPLAKRIHAVLEKRIRFFKGDEEIDRAVALSSLITRTPGAAGAFAPAVG